MRTNLTLTTQLVEREDTGKKRILLGIIKDDWLEISVVLTADQARDLAERLLELERIARGRSIILPGGAQA